MRFATKAPSRFDWRRAGRHASAPSAAFPKTSCLPGESVDVEIAWNTISAQRYYSQTATIRTDDPDNEEIILRVYGSVLNQIVVEPETLSLPRVEPGKSAEAGVLVYSQVWPNFTLENVRCSLPGFRLNVKAVEPQDELIKVSGNCYRLSVEAPADLPSGGFQGAVYFDLVPQDKSSEPQAYELLLGGKVLRSFALYGPQIDSDGVIDLGLLTSGDSSEVRLLVKIRDEQKDPRVREIQVEPPFVSARLEPATDDAAAKGVYRLFVSIPENSPNCDYTDNLGTLKIVTDHPRIGTVDLKLRFSVVGRL